MIEKEKKWKKQNKTKLNEHESRTKRKKGPTNKKIVFEFQK